MPLFAIFAGAAARAYGIMQSAKTALVDAFTRTTSGSLGSFWTNVRGTWFANGTQAQSNDAASNYSLASATLASNDMSVSASVGGGGGVAFWVSDANNWWAASYTNTSSSYQCNCATCPTYCCNSCTVTSSTYCGSAWGCSNGYVCQTNKCCVGGGSVIGNATQSPLTCTVYNNCAACGQYECGSTPCNCQTCTDIFHYLRLSRSVAGTITTSVVSDVTLSQAAVAVKVDTSGNTITARAYSNTTLTSVIGTINSTQTSPTKAPKAGIIKIPSSYTQSSTIDDFVAEG
jgi:hypothetical protein